MTDNALSPTPLSDIRGHIDASRSLTLSETTLGAEQFQLLQQIFPHQKEFVVSDCGNLSSANLPLIFSGTFAQLFPWTKMRAEVCLFDTGEGRHVVIRISRPEADTAYAYLSQYSVDPGEPISPDEVAPTTGLGSCVQEISFSPAASHMVFSTLDYTAKGADQSVYPDAWKAEFPVRHVNKGLNFSADITLGEGLHGSLQFMLHGFDNAAPKHRCLISGDEYGPRFRLTRALTGSLTIAPLRLNLTGTSIGLPLARPLGAPLWPHILVEGTVIVDTIAVEVTAALHTYFPELSLSFTGFPSLGQLITHVGLSLNSLPVPLSQMLDVTLSTLTIVLNLNEKSVSEISFSLTTKGDMDLIKDVISLKPTLTMQIYFPLDAEWRSIEGSLKGHWTFEGITFNAELAYPSLQFYAGMDKPVSTKRLLQRLLPGIDLPELSFTKMEIEGNVLAKSFWARIEAEIGSKDDTTWGFNVSGLTEIRLGMVYANQQTTHCAVECTLPLAGVSIALSARYDAGQDGLQFEGRTTTAIDITSVIRDLGRLFDIQRPEVPAILQSFKIEALHVSFNTQSKDFTCTCDGALTIEKTAIKGTVTLDLTHRQDGSVSTHFSGQITLRDGVQFALIFDTAGEDRQALGIYHNPYGESRKIGELIGDISVDLAAAVPASLAFTLHDALLGYAKPGKDKDAKWLFGVDIEGGLNLSDVKLPDFPLLSQFAPSPEQTLKLAVQVVGAKTPFTVEEVVALNALNPGGLQLPHKAIEGLALAASLRLGQESKQLSLPIGLKKDDLPAAAGNNSLTSDATAATPHSGAQAVSDDGMQWVTIQKSFGPVHFERVGIAYSGGNIRALLDAALSVGGLTIALDGLSVTSPLTKFDPTFALRGLGIDYRNGPLEIGGAFLKQTMKEGEATYTSFAGLAVLRTQQLSLSAIGSYAVKDGHPSLFIYAVLDYPLGGPSFFFVTGLAAGFGYNRALSLPTIEQVESFPLVQQALSQGQNGNKAQGLPADQQQQQALLTARLEALEGSIPRSVGEHFLAIGLRFTSFKRINSFALLTVKFGKELEFDLLGISTLSVPKVAEARLALKATFNPDSGFLGVRAQLTPPSYILSGACHLTGGFAFYSWFKDQPAQAGNPPIKGGDFVLTLGGYHPAYDPPAHYPRVPRLGFNWQVEDQYLQLKGDAYYAMTPNALMAGAHLEAAWQKDQLKAWFVASADFLINWEPYHYDARLYIDLGATYTFDLFGSQTVSVDLGADLHLWGPDFTGEAKIHWWIISFTVSFGHAPPSSGLRPIDWNAFQKAFLPDQICGIAVQNGLVRQLNDGNQERWIVNPKDFALVTNSAIPSTQARQVTKLAENSSAPEYGAIDFAPRTPLGVRPAAVESMQSTQTITITKQEAGRVKIVPFTYTPVLKAMPAALWGAPQFADDARKDFLRLPDIHDDKALIENAVCGFEIRPRNLPASGATVPFKPRFYETELIPNAFEWEDWTLTDTDLRGKKALEAARGFNDPENLKKRDLVFKALGFANSNSGFLATP